MQLRWPVDHFDLQGEVRGECVTFETSEEVPGVGNLIYSFRGTHDGFGRRIEGSFTGVGPGSSCTTRGTFAVELQ